MAVSDGSLFLYCAMTTHSEFWFIAMCEYYSPDVVSVHQLLLMPLKLTTLQELLSHINLQNKTNIFKFDH